MTPTPTAAPLAVAPLVVSLPRDDAPHPGSNTEWWYYNGHLETAEGDRYGFHYVVFQVAAPGRLVGVIAHAAVTDAGRGVYATDQRGALMDRQAGPEGGGFSFDLEGWRMSGNAGLDRLSFTVGDYAVRVALSPASLPALHDGTGLVDFGDAGASYYYSRTRMAAAGTVTAAGRETAVTGTAWFDHQWGDFEARALGWDWFALQLDDGSDVMLTVLRDEDGRPLRRYGTLVSPDGVTHIPGDAFEVASTGSWTSPTSGATYPMGWVVRMPGWGIDVALTPVLEAAEFEAVSTTRNYYWEGGVLVEGSVGGLGFVEMTGYAPMRFPSAPAPTPSTGGP